MSARFVYRPDGPFGPDVIDRKNGHWMSLDLAREYAAVVNAADAPTLTEDAAAQAAAQREIVASLREMTDLAIQVDGWQSFPLDPIERAKAVLEKCKAVGIGSSKEGGDEA